ncbi:MAG: hypothetical protein ABSE82_10870 [Nitrososphaerales archaeon]|jgi:hypothetical protein
METFINLSLTISFSFLMIAWGFKHIGCFRMGESSNRISQKESEHRMRRENEGLDD